MSELLLGAVRMLLQSFEKLFLNEFASKCEKILEYERVTFRSTAHVVARL